MDENFKTYRKRVGTLADISKILGVKLATVDNWELGKTYPRRESLKKLCELFGLTEGEIFALIDNSKRVESMSELESPIDI